MVHDSNNRLKQFTDQQKKGQKSDLINLQTRWEKLKMYQKVKKALKYNPFLSFRACQKKIVDFTDLAHIFYWPAKTDKKDNLDNLSICVSTKYIPNNVGVSWHFQNGMHNI